MPHITPKQMKWLQEALQDWQHHAWLNAEQAAHIRAHYTVSSPYSWSFLGGFFSILLLSLAAFQLVAHHWDTLSPNVRLVLAALLYGLGALTLYVKSASAPWRSSLVYITGMVLAAIIIAQVYQLQSSPTYFLRSIMLLCLPALLLQRHHAYHYLLQIVAMLYLYGMIDHPIAWLDVALSLAIIACSIYFTPSSPLLLFVLTPALLLLLHHLKLEDAGLNTLLLVALSYAAHEYWARNRWQSASSALALGLLIIQLLLFNSGAPYGAPFWLLLWLAASALLLWRKDWGRALLIATPAMLLLQALQPNMPFFPYFFIMALLVNAHLAANKQQKGMMVLFYASLALYLLYMMSQHDLLENALILMLASASIFLIYRDKNKGDAA